MLLEVDETRCQEALQGLADGDRVRFASWPVDPLEPAVYLPHLYDAEEGAARAVAALLDRKHEDQEALLRVDDCADALGLDLSDDQGRALQLALSQGTSIITGGPGTGKTTILRVLLEATSLQIALEPRVTAHDGRAAAICWDGRTTAGRR